MKCPNCKSENFVEKITIEYCPDCGIECDYHNGGMNEAYKSFMEEKYEKENINSCLEILKNKEK